MKAPSTLLSEALKAGAEALQRESHSDREQAERAAARGDAPSAGTLLVRAAETLSQAELLTKESKRVLSVARVQS